MRFCVDTILSIDIWLHTAGAISIQHIAKSFIYYS